MENQVEQGGRKGLTRMVLLAVLFGLGFWIYQQITLNYEILAASQRMTEQLLDHQTTLTKEYAQKLTLLEENFKETQTLLSGVQEENRKLNQQIVLLSQVTDLQSTVSSLKEENTQILLEINDLKRQLAYERKDVESIPEGLAFIKRFKDRIFKVKGQIKELKNNAYLQKIADQREKDRTALMLGNNGFLIRDGQLTVANSKRPAAEKKDIQVDVTFVK